MSKYFFGVAVSLLSGVAVAADCSVTGNTVTCEPDETYVPANHNGKKINEYELVVLHRTASNLHGYVQFSNQVVFQDAHITVEGSQSDGVTLRNYGPTVDFNNLVVNASGLSGDGINLGRDNSGGEVRVHENATINVAQGMGIRSVASEMDHKKHIIRFTGGSTITTQAAGSWDAGHAVFAGTQSSGCGPSILKFYACRALAPGEVHLLGGVDQLHTISTTGKAAHGLYASGRGSIFAENVFVHTTAEKAHGMFAERQSKSYYYNQNDRGSQDYAGNIELRGNVAIVVEGVGAYALFADSGSAQSGADAEGNIAAIRSYNSELGQAVQDKNYQITGNIFATNSGVIDVAMGEGSRFIGGALVDNNGVLNLQLAGRNSAWNMTENSAVSSLTLRDGAGLVPVPANASSPSAYTLAGRVTNQGGVINLAANALVGDSLIIDGDYASDNGHILFNTLLSDDNSPVDKLVVTGDTSGQGMVGIVDQGGAGAATGKGIQIIEVRGQSGADFRLAGDYVHGGEAAVVVGAYAYKLRKGDKADISNGHWYLLSDVNSQPEPEPKPDPEPDPEPESPNYSAGTPMYEVYPQLLLALNTLPTMQQRLGERYWGSARAAGGAAFEASNALSGASGNSGIQGIKEGPWVRLVGSHSKVRPRSSTTGSTYDYDIFSMQIGLDKELSQRESGRVFAGLSFVYGDAKADVSSVHGDGDIKTNSYGVAGNLTWYGNNGFYVDAQAQKNWFRTKLYSSLAHKNLSQGKNKGDGYAFSLEAGQRLPINDAWSITPQLQLQYNDVKFDTFSTQWLSARSRVSHEKSNSLLARVGGSVDYHQNEGQGTSSSVYGTLNLYNEFSGKTKVKVERTQFMGQRERLMTSVGVGGLYSWNDGKYAVYGEGSVNSSIKHFSDSYGYQATLGFRLLW